MSEQSDQEMLAELQRLNATLTRRANWVHAIAIVLFGVFLFVVYGARLPSHPPSPTPAVQNPVPDTWQEASRLMEDGKLDDAKEMLHGLNAKYPDYFYGYTLLGSLHQQLGDFAAAESNFAKAYDLFPTEENVKALVAIRKAIDNKKANANKTAERSAP